MTISLACVVNELDSHVESNMEDQIAISLGRKIGNSARALEGTKSKQLKKRLAVHYNA
jgi:hypothetical protein